VRAVKKAVGTRNQVFNFSAVTSLRDVAKGIELYGINYSFMSIAIEAVALPNTSGQYSSFSRVSHRFCKLLALKLQRSELIEIRRFGGNVVD
jgi:hypothetical protein